MTKQSTEVIPVNYLLVPGFVIFPSGPTLISTVLGSCVAISLYDRKRKTGGMNSFQFPIIREKHRATTRFGNVAIITLIQMMREDGSECKDMEAQIFGGAHNQSVSSTNIGMDNIRIARRILTRERILISSEDVGGEKGRKIVYHTHTNEAAVFRVDKLRLSDWYPFKDDRR
ncbi:MAG: chemotaxis protein CheD [Desulfatirhabdiaceae bacterium]